MEKTLNERPNLIKERIDMKAFTTMTFSNTIAAVRNGEINDISIHPETKCTIFTTIGTVEGTILIDNDKNSPLSLLVTSIFQARNNILDEFESEGVNRLINDSGHISLKDVTITPYNGGPYNLGYFLLYSDQIVGLTFGNY